MKHYLPIWGRRDIHEKKEWTEREVKERGSGDIVGYRELILNGKEGQGCPGSSITVFSLPSIYPFCTRPSLDSDARYYSSSMRRDTCMV